MNDIQVMFERVFTMMRDCYWGNRPVLPRTMLFNEGWLLRLALDWFNGHGDAWDGPFAMPLGVRWYSEALLPTHFKARVRTGDALAESRTHADAVVGFASLAQEGVRDLFVEPESTHFVVLEAKLGSGLSMGTRNVPWYDQAARSVACMAEALAEPRCGTRPGRLQTLGFHVVAPRERLATGIVAQHLQKDGIRAKVEHRVKQYDDRRYERWFEEWFEPTLAAMDISAVSWEDVVDAIRREDQAEGKAFAEFYECCLRHNGMDEAGRKVTRRAPRAQAPPPASSRASAAPTAGPHSSLVCGVDGCPGGWVVVWHDLDADELQWEVVPRLTDLLTCGRRPLCAAVDVPIGLLDEGTRICDSEARKRLPGRTSTVFTAPIRPIFEANSFEEANAIGRAVEGKGISKQAWAIVPKVCEADEALREHEALREIVREVHPELCFASLNGGRPMAHKKKDASGREERTAVLRHRFGEVVDRALASRPRGCGADDMLDAFACACTAARVVRGEADVIPAVPCKDRFGLTMEMVI